MRLGLEWSNPAFEKQVSCNNAKGIKLRPLNQAIPGNDQNAFPTNQKTSGSKLDRLWLLEESGKLYRWFFGANMFAGMSSQVLGEKFDV